MSKFFNETQKANQLALQRLSAQDLDVRKLVETIRQEGSLETPGADRRNGQREMVKLADGAVIRLVLGQDDSSKAALEAYRSLRTRLMRLHAKAGLKSICIASSVSGEGKTLTTMNLGLCYAQLPEQRVLLIDADLSRCGLTGMLEHPGAPGLVEVLAGQIPLDDAIVAASEKNLFVLPAGTVSPPPKEPFTGPRWQEFVTKCRELFTVTLIDSPPILPLGDFELVSAACEGVLMVVRARHADREILQKTASGIDRKKLVGIVLNGADAGEKQYYGYRYGDGKSR